MQTIIHRHPANAPVRRAAAVAKATGEPGIRRKAIPPSDWMDIGRERPRCWKRHRRRQWMR